MGWSSFEATHTNKKDILLYDYFESFGEYGEKIGYRAASGHIITVEDISEKQGCIFVGHRDTNTNKYFIFAYLIEKDRANEASIKIIDGFYAVPIPPKLMIKKVLENIKEYPQLYTQKDIDDINEDINRIKEKENEQKQKQAEKNKLFPDYNKLSYNQELRCFMKKGIGTEEKTYEDMEEVRGLWSGKHGIFIPELRAFIAKNRIKKFLHKLEIA